MSPERMLGRVCSSLPAHCRVGTFHCQFMKMSTDYMKDKKDKKCKKTGHLCAGSRHIGKNRTIFHYARTRVLSFLYSSFFTDKKTGDSSTAKHNPGCCHSHHRPFIW